VSRPTAPATGGGADRGLQCLGLLALLLIEPGVADEESVQQGRYLLHAGGCYACHTDTENDGEPLAGGLTGDGLRGILQP
jgi:mono/diheme cytochrome c family protein